MCQEDYSFAPSRRAQPIKRIPVERDVIMTSCDARYMFGESCWWLLDNWTLTNKFCAQSTAKHWPRCVFSNKRVCTQPLFSRGGDSMSSSPRGRGYIMFTYTYIHIAARCWFWGVRDYTHRQVASRGKQRARNHIAHQVDFIAQHTKGNVCLRDDEDGDRDTHLVSGNIRRASGVAETTNNYSANTCNSDTPNLAVFLCEGQPIYVYAAAVASPSNHTPPWNHIPHI